MDVKDSPTVCPLMKIFTPSFGVEGGKRVVVVCAVERQITEHLQLVE